MTEMFSFAISFKKDLKFNTASVTSMHHMFNGAKSFNGDLSGFDTTEDVIIYSNVLGIIPPLLPSTLFSPIIVCVLPVPVAPYANMVALYPFNT